MGPASTNGQNTETSIRLEQEQDAKQRVADKQESIETIEHPSIPLSSVLNPMTNEADDKRSKSLTLVYGTWLGYQVNDVVVQVYSLLYKLNEQQVKEENNRWPSNTRVYISTNPVLQCCVEVNPVRSFVYSGA